MSTAEQFGNFASTNMIQEATAFKTVKAGSYDIQVSKVYEMNIEEGFARVGANVVSEGQKRGMVFFRIQWTEKRNSNGKLAAGCKLYAQMLKALHPSATLDELSKIDAATLLNEAEKYPVSAFISEYYSVKDDSNPPYTTSRRYPKSPEEVKAVLSEGGIAKNDVVSIYAKK